jgi:hypothetical protein
MEDEDFHDLFQRAPLHLVADPDGYIVLRILTGGTLLRTVTVSEPPSRGDTVTLSDGSIATIVAIGQRLLREQFEIEATVRLP